MANTRFTRAVKKAKGLYKSGRYKTFADAVKAAYKKTPGKAKAKRKPAARKSPRRRISAIKTKSAVHNDYNRPEVNISIGGLKSQLRQQYRKNLSHALLRREEARRKTDKRKANKAVIELRNALKRL